MALPKLEKPVAPKPVLKPSPSPVQAPQATPVPTSVTNPIPTPQAVYTAPVESENWYEQWIFNEESGNNPTRWNSSGCVGIGQACPASKLLAVCPTLDYVCEVNYFTDYMLERYGSWETAYNFHIANGWW